MGDKDPPPFGYTFNDFFDSQPPALDNAGPSLLSDMENQSLADFFSSTDPFHLSDTAFPPATNVKDVGHDYNNWESFIAPATVHHVTTIPDQTQLQQRLHHDQPYPPLATSHSPLQPLPVVFGNPQPFSSPPSHRRQTSDGASGGLPMVATSHGLIREQLAALIPNHSEQGTLDAQFAAQWAVTSAQRQHEPEFGPFMHASGLKQPYAFGTDTSFNNPTVYSATHTHKPDGQASRKTLRKMRHSQSSLSNIPATNGPHGQASIAAPLPSIHHLDPSDDERSEEPSSGDDDDKDKDRPAKRRRKSTQRIDKGSVVKVARAGKSCKASSAEENSKKKRSSLSAQKMQRENLSEEQKRSNHILSEQKRRNLIKRGFDDLHDLVPEIRNGGLSKSSVLMEAANFLEKLIQDNHSFWRLAGGLPVTASG